MHQFIIITIFIFINLNLRFLSCHNMFCECFSNIVISSRRKLNFKRNLLCTAPDTLKTLLSLWLAWQHSNFIKIIHMLNHLPFLHFCAIYRHVNNLLSALHAISDRTVHRSGINITHKHTRSDT